MERARDYNPQTVHLNARQRGYTRFMVDTGRWTTQFRVVADVTNPASPVVTDRDIRTSDI